MYIILFIKCISSWSLTLQKYLKHCLGVSQIIYNETTQYAIFLGYFLVINCATLALFLVRSLTAVVFFSTCQMYCNLVSAAQLLAEFPILIGSKLVSVRPMSRQLRVLGVFRHWHINWFETKHFDARLASSKALARRPSSQCASIFVLFFFFFCTVTEPKYTFIYLYVLWTVGNWISRDSNWVSWSSLRVTSQLVQQIKREICLFA